jgi:hypothetical protein
MGRDTKHAEGKDARGLESLQGRGMDLLRGRKEGHMELRLRWTRQFLGGSEKGHLGRGGEREAVTVLAGEMSVVAGFLKRKKEKKRRVGARALTGNAHSEQQQPKHEETVGKVELVHHGRLGAPEPTATTAAG